MSKKHRSRAQAPSVPQAAPRQSRTGLYVAAGIALVIGIAALAWMAMLPKSSSRTEAELAALQRPHAASIGDAGAPVQIVEFLDPACETCAQFFPLVKGMMRDHPGDIRLSVRLLPFHQGSDVAVQALEAARLQGKFWPVLEHLLATQSKWTVAHKVDTDQVWRELRTLDLDIPRLAADMASPAVRQNMALDMQDAKTLKVTATPEYFVNGRGLPEFGYEPLRRLVDEERRNVKR